MENIIQIIRQWIIHCGTINEPKLIGNQFTYHGFAAEYERYYNGNLTKSDRRFTAEDLKNAVYSPDGYHVDNNISSEYVCIKYSKNTCWRYVKNLIIGYEVHIFGNEFVFDIVIEPNDRDNQSTKISVNAFLNEYLKEVRFTRGLIINTYDELRDIFRNMFVGCAELSTFIDKLSCPEYFRFILQTDFLEKYEKMNLLCNRNEVDFKADKQTIIGMLNEYEDVSVKYYSKERYYKTTKIIGDISIGYNIEIRYNTLINFIIWGEQNGVRLLFSEPGIECIINDLGSGHKLHRLEFHSLGELKKIFDFMMKYLDILASFFDGTYEK